MKNKINIIEESEKVLQNKYKQIENIALLNQEKVLCAFQKFKVSSNNFMATNGYGYDDIGRNKLCEIFANVFNAESAIVSPNITCGTHALCLMLYGLLKPNDTILNISGQLYDTIFSIIKNEGDGSLTEIGVKYNQIDLVNNDFDEKQIITKIGELKPKIIYIQRSRGYVWRNALTIKKIKQIISTIRNYYKEGYIVVDNCYGTFVEELEPTDVGADVMAGSLIKNAGGSLAPTGGYIVGKKSAIESISKRMTTPTLGQEVGSYAYGYRLFYQGLFLAPHIVCQAIKTILLIGQVMTNYNCKVLSNYNDDISDIVQAIEFSNEHELVKFVQLIQKLSPIDSHIVPYPWDMPGYDDKIIMAAGTFVSGASIELSCDSPIRKPYIAYLQGGITYEHGKIVAKNLVNEFDKN